jgi:hypothetical protein
MPSFPDERHSDRGGVTNGSATVWMLALMGISIIAYAASDDSFLGGPPGFGRMQQALAGLGVGMLVLTRSKPHWRIRVLLAAASMAVSSAAMEIALRPHWVPRLFVPFRLDDDLLCERIPGRRAIHRLDPANGSREVDHSTNRDGFRGEPLRPHGATFRVAVFGDSFIEAIYTPLAESFCERLETEIAHGTDRECEVVNCGVAGYGPDQSFLRMRKELGKLRPDLVVFSIFTGNDFGDLERNKIFDVGEDGRLIRRYPVLAEEERAKIGVGYREAVILRLLRRLLGRGATPALLPPTDNHDGGSSVLAHYIANAASEHADYYASTVVRNLSVDLFNADCALTPEVSSARHRRELMAGVLREVRFELAGSGIPVVVLIIPYVLDVCPRSGYQVDLSSYPAYRPENLRDAVVDICRDAMLDACDLFSAFRQRECDELFLRGWDDHWSAAGQALGARVLADQLRDRGLLPIRVH